LNLKLINYEFYSYNQDDVFLNFKTSDRPFLKILLLFFLPFLSLFCSSYEREFIFAHSSEQQFSNFIASCHQCGEKCDKHVNCENERCHLLFIQCPSCAEKLDNCCSDSCASVVALSEDKQRELRKGTHNSNKIFKKGRAHHLKTVNP
jgi:hypothetical protein